MWYTVIYCIYTSNIFIHLIYFIFSILYLKVEFLNLPGDDPVQDLDN